jgi:hypothetical protein
MGHIDLAAKAIPALPARRPASVTAENLVASEDRPAQTRSDEIQHFAALATSSSDSEIFPQRNIRCPERCNRRGFFWWSASHSGGDPLDCLCRRQADTHVQKMSSKRQHRMKSGRFSLGIEGLIAVTIFVLLVIALPD